MKITTLNIKHGGGARTEKIIAALDLNSEILVLTEFRNNKNGEIIRKGLSNFGFVYHYSAVADSKKNSVLIACKQKFEVEIFPELGDHSQRVIKISSVDFTLFGTYFPNGDEKKYVFDFLIKYILEYPNEKIIMTGDFNTGKHYIDEEGATFFHANYFEKLDQLGYSDAWRLIHGSKKEFTWYSNAGNGFRLDHFFVHEALKNNVSNCYYDHQIRINKVSDHSMMTLVLNPQ